MTATMMNPQASDRPSDAAAGAESRRHLLHVFATLEVGGPQTRFIKLASGLGRKYRHTLVAADGNTACLSRLDPAVDATALALDIRKSRWPSPRNLMTLRRLLGDRRPDLLVSYNWGAIEAPLANRLWPGCPTLHFEDGFGPDETATTQFRRRIWFRRLALGGTTRIVVPSRLLERIITQVWRIDPARVLYVPNGVDCARFAAEPDPALIPGYAGWRPALVIGSVGRLAAVKNFRKLIRAVAALARTLPVGLVLVGDGPERPALEAEARALGIADRVLLTGRIDRPEAVLGLFDVYALSSDTEQMPLSLLEAMAAGLPVAATDVGDVKDMVAAENRPLVVDPADPAGFVAGLARLLTDADMRRRLGEANRRHVRSEFDESAMITAYDALFAG